MVVVASRRGTRAHTEHRETPGANNRMDESHSGDLSVQASFWAVVPAGGAGTRLWPLSRAARPTFLPPSSGGAPLTSSSAPAEWS
jgi:hypothetical protein